MRNESLAGWCRGCGQTVVDAPGTTGRCPECGHDLREGIAEFRQLAARPGATAALAWSLTFLSAALLVHALAILLFGSVGELERLLVRAVASEQSKLALRYPIWALSSLRPCVGDLVGTSANQFALIALLAVCVAMRRLRTLDGVTAAAALCAVVLVVGATVADQLSLDALVGRSSQSWFDARWGEYLPWRSDRLGLFRIAALLNDLALVATLLACVRAIRRWCPVLQKRMLAGPLVLLLLAVALNLIRRFSIAGPSHPALPRGPTSDAWLDVSMLFVRQHGLVFSWIAVIAAVISIFWIGWLLRVAAGSLHECARVAGRSQTRVERLLARPWTWITLTAAMNVLLIAVLLPGTFAGVTRARWRADWDGLPSPLLLALPLMLPAVAAAITGSWRLGLKLAAVAALSIGFGAMIVIGLGWAP